MYSMKETCQKTGLTYETLKFYCNQELVPNVKRNEQNHRIFDDNNIEWLKNLSCLRDCGMTISEMRDYIKLVTKGEETIPTRQEILNLKRKDLELEIAKLQHSLNYIDSKQQFYEDVLSGKEAQFKFPSK